MKRLIVFAAVVLAGCQGTPVGDAMIGKAKLAMMDDEYCRSIGAVPKSDTYMQCRMYRDAQREQNHRAAFARAGAAFSAAGASMQANRPVNCTSRRIGYTVSTSCY